MKFGISQLVARVSQRNAVTNSWPGSKISTLAQTTCHACLQRTNTGFLSQRPATLQVCRPSDDPDFNPKLYVKSDWNPPREDPDLEESLYHVRQELLENFSENTPLWKSNLSRDKRNGLREIKEDPTVRVLSTDKNLGPAVVSTEWVENETLKHLNDSNSYTKVTLDDWTIRRRKVIETREKLTHSYSHFRPPNSLKFLRSLDNNTKSSDPAKFYIIPKIHSHRWLAGLWQRLTLISLDLLVYLWMS